MNVIVINVERLMLDDLQASMYSDDHDYVFSGVFVPVVEVVNEVYDQLYGLQ